MKNSHFFQNFVFFLLFLLVQPMLAQGTENALKAAGIFFITISVIGLLAVVAFIVFLAARSKTTAIISSLSGTLLMIIGYLIFSATQRFSDTEFDSISTLFITGGAINLLLIYSLTVLFQRKKRAAQSSLLEGTLDKPEKPANNPIVKWVCFFLAVRIFYEFHGQIDYILRLVSEIEWRVVFPIEFYFGIMGFLFLIAMVSTEVLLLKGKRAGWHLLLFLCIHAVIFQTTDILHTSFSSQFAKLHIPLSLRIVRISMVLIHVLVIYLLLKKEFRSLYRIENRVLTGSIAGSLVITIILFVIGYWEIFGKFT